MLLHKLMTPKKSVFLIDGNQKVSKVIDKVFKSGYHYFPVYEKSKDHVIGVVSTDILIKAIREKKSAKLIKTLTKEHFVIPETIDKIDFGKGPYYANKGNFATKRGRYFNR